VDGGAECETLVLFSALGSGHTIAELLNWWLQRCLADGTKQPLNCPGELRQSPGVW